MIHIITENNELRHRKFKLPDGIKSYLNDVLKKYKGDKTIDGYKRLNNILDMDGISYLEMKRIKNFFDNYNGSDKSTEFILNGGEPMKLWVNNTLYTATKAVHDYKQAKKDAGIKNAFIKHHEKERQIKKNKPTQVKFKTDNTSSNIFSDNLMKYESISKKVSQLNENNNILSVLPKKVFSQIAKLNDAVNAQKQYMEDEFCLKERDGYDYSLSTIVVNDNGEMEYDIRYDDLNKTHYHEKIPLVSEYDGELWFNEDDFKEYMKQYKSDLKRALKYYQEYGSHDSDYEEGGEERAFNRVSNNESKNHKKS